MSRESGAYTVFALLKSRIFTVNLFKRNANINFAKNYVNKESV